MQIWLSGCFLKERKWSSLGHLRLADFGLSRRLERGGRAFTICGTIQYMGEMSQHHLHSYLHLKWICCSLMLLNECWWGGTSCAVNMLPLFCSPRGAERWTIQPCSWLVVTGNSAFFIGYWQSEVFTTVVMTVSFTSVWRVFWSYFNAAEDES